MVSRPELWRPVKKTGVGDDVERLGIAAWFRGVGNDRVTTHVQTLALLAVGSSLSTP